MVLINALRHTGSYGPITIVNARAAPARAGARGARGASDRRAARSPFEGQGMWIWYVSPSNGGNVASIIAQAHAAGVTTLFIKSSDGSSELLEPVLAPARRRNCTPAG